MTAPGCFVRADLSEVRLVGLPTPTQPWKPSPPSGENEADAMWWLKQAEAAAQWTAERLAGERVISVVCIDTRDLSCVRLMAPTADPAVVAATIRQNSQELADFEPHGLVQPLTDSVVSTPGGVSPWSLPMLSRLSKRFGASANPADQAAVRLAAVLGPDGMLRLWLEELDRRGVRVGLVTTLWHAASIAWRPSGGQPDAGDAASLDAVVLIDDDVMTWAWARAGRLSAGGTYSIPRLPPAHDPADEQALGKPPSAPKAPTPGPPDYPAAVSRLTLDWLTWSAQMGDSPRRINAVGKPAVELKTMLKKAWPEAEVSAALDNDPVGSALRRLCIQAESPGTAGADAGLADDDPRISVVSLSRRRGRAHRRMYTAVGAALALLACGVGAYGWLRRETAGAYREAAETIRSETKVVVSEVSPDLASSAIPRKALESLLERLRKNRPDIADPAAAKPVLDELDRIVAVMAAMGEQGVNVVDISVQEGFPTARITTPSFEVGEDFTRRVRDLGTKVRWTVQFEKRDGNIFTYRLDGQWEGT